MPSILFVSIGFSISVSCSAAQAGEGTLELPNRASANIELIVQSDQAEFEPSEMLQVYVGGQEACCANKLPVAGHYSVDGRKVIFDPAFDLLEGQAYTVATQLSGFSPDNRNPYTLSEFNIEKTSRDEMPKVVAIYPSGDAIPENTLRFYIHFSVAMQPHRSSQFIKLVDSDGRADTEAFMDFKQELWSEDRKRLTLLVDPGRIKRGVAQNIALGPALLEGDNFSIVIEPGWQTAHGSNLIERFENPFSVSKALRTRPDHDLWTVESPRVLTDDVLRIQFDRTFDHELLQRGISVLDNDGLPIQGTVSVKNHEKAWQFVPENVWHQSQIHIAVDKLLEDVAGNNFIELLDHPVDTEVLDTNRNVITVQLNPSPI